MEVLTHEYGQFTLGAMVSFHLVKESIDNVVLLFLLTLMDILTLIRVSIAYALSLVTPIKLCFEHIVETLRPEISRECKVQPHLDPPDILGWLDGLLLGPQALLHLRYLGSPTPVLSLGPQARAVQHRNPG